MGIFRKIGMAAAVSILFVACGDDNSTKANDNEPTGPVSDADYEVDDYEDLPNCTSKKEGATGFVIESGEGYVCKGGDWVRDDKAVDVVKSSSSQKGWSSSSSRGSSVQQNISYGELKDSRDGQVYKTVKITEMVFVPGSITEENSEGEFKYVVHTWMAENLNYEMDNSYCYDDDATNCDKYGRLYTWAAAMDSAGVVVPSGIGKGCGYNTSCFSKGRVRGACPSGWHLPSKTEFETLIRIVGNGAMLKSTSDWYDNGNGTDDYGFSALPAGNRNYNGSYDGAGYFAGFWSSTMGNTSAAVYSMNLHNDSESAGLSADRAYYGSSVRCLQDP